VSSIVTNPETAKVKIGDEAAGTMPAGETVDLAKELAPELASVKVPDQVDPQVKDALDKLRAGTAKGLSPKDHYDLGVAYMGMGLVDDAVREFNVAKDGKAKGAGKALADAKAKAKGAIVGNGKAAKGKTAKRPAKKAAKPSKAAKASKAASKVKAAPKGAKARGKGKAAARKPARKK
jgi:valyl-tRNA synthetase